MRRRGLSWTQRLIAFVFGGLLVYAAVDSVMKGALNSGLTAGYAIIIGLFGVLLIAVGFKLGSHR